MSLVNSALQIGKSALLAYQSSLQVVSNNIANLGSEGYSRQSPNLTPLSGVYENGGYTSGGVALSSVRRNVDEALNVRLRMALSDQESASAQYTALSELESLFNSLSDVDLSSQLNEFFGAWSDLQNTPEEPGVRSIVLAQGEALAEGFQRTTQLLANEHESLNSQIEQTLGRINEIAADVADLNLQVVAAEAKGGQSASMLRDQRSNLLSELSELVTVQVHEQPDGGVNVYVGNEPIVQRSFYREMTTTREIVNGHETAIVRWQDNNKQISPWGGKLEGLMTARDAHVVGQMDYLDDLAVALISDVNRIHASGQGLEGYNSLTGSYDVLDATVALNTADNGLTYLPDNGSFTITVADGTNQAKTIRIDVDLDGIGADTTLASLAANITATAAAEGVNLTATATPDNRLRIDAGPGETFTFGDDTSGVLGALGLNTFFAGENAASIRLDDGIIGKPKLVAAGQSPNSGDGSNAGLIAELATAESRYLNSGQSLLDRYNAVMGDLAVTTAAAKNAVEASDVIRGSLTAQWESVSGVNLDEETLMLMRYQRAFQGAARIVSVVDELIQQLLAM
ncbi:MAG: flagellar hook-associated protein FlgK [Phycisphaerae bacterium]|nr:flagellar hook-associated protein FlgK [Phycisphaerae bacterium]